MKKPLPHSSLSKSERESRRNKIKAFVILLVVCVVWLFPFVYVFGMSLRTTEDLVLYPNSIFRIPAAGHLTTTWTSSVCTTAARSTH